ncbi:MAG: ATP-binding cassette domain-containing protein [Candidatus Dojkabacteria bacterium]
MKVYVLIPTRNRKELLDKCLSSLDKQTYEDFEVVVIDDGSTDGTEEVLRKHKVTVLQGDGNLWWTGAMRKGVDYVLSKCSENDYILLQNDDTYMESDFIENLIRDIKSNPKSLLGTAVKDFETKEYLYNTHRYKKCILQQVVVKTDESLIESETLSGRGTLIPVEVFQKLGNFSRLLPHYGSDYEIAFRAKSKGYKLLMSTDSVTYSTSKKPSLAKRIKSQEYLSLKDFYLLFFSRRSYNNLWSSTIITILHSPGFRKFYVIIRIYLYVIKVLLVDCLFKGIFKIRRPKMKIKSLIRRKMSFIFKLNDLLTKQEKRRFILVLVVDIMRAILQAVGIVSILPFMNIVMDPMVIETNQYLSYLYEFFNFSSQNSFIFVLGLSVLALLVIGNLVSVWSIKMKTKFVWELNSRLSTSLLRKYLSLPYSYFLDHNSSDLVKNILTEVNLLSGEFLNSILTVIEGAVISLVIFVMLLVVNPTMTLTTLLVLSIIYLVIYLVFSRRLKRAGKERIAENRARFKSVGEAIGGIKYTKVLGKESYFINDYLVHAKRFSKLQTWYRVIGKTPRYIMEIVAFGGIIGVVLFFIRSGKMSDNIISLIGLFAFAGYRLLPALQNVYDSFTVFRFNREVLNKIHYDMKEGALGGVDVDVSESRVEPLKFEREIKLSNIDFSYQGDRKKVLKDINIEIQKGSSVGIVGTTGSGKTTLVDVVMGLLTPTTGEIFIDKTKIDSNNVRNWQANLGYVPQDIFLSDNSITKNIAFGYEDEYIDVEQVKKVAEMANIHEFIENELPDKYDTIIGERGVRLSGGQRQRIGIARALYHNPEVLIFDEATSALDNVTEKSVLEAIETVSKLKTMIIIAHRLTTVENCDIVYLMDDGEVVDSGTYQELEAENEIFKEMLKAST